MDKDAVVSFLQKVAPTVAAAVWGPMGLSAYSALATIFGVDTPKQVDSAIASGAVTAEQMLAIKRLDGELKQQEAEMGFRYSELEATDRSAARTREAQTGDKVNRNLAYLIVIAFIALTIGTLIGWTRVDSVLAGTLVGYLSAKCEQILAYYFGSTKGSARKTELLAESPTVRA